MDIDERVERLLRSQAPADPRHPVGAFRDRLVATALQPRIVVRARFGSSSPALGFAVLALGLTALLAIVPTFLLGGVQLARPNPNPTPAPAGAVVPARLQTALDTWAAATGARAAAAVIGRNGDRWLGSSGGQIGSAPDPGATVRIGEVSAVFVASAILTLDECARGVEAHSCPPAPHGPLRLDDTLEHWIPGWPGGADITIRMLLAGTSGLAPAGPTIADLLAPGAAPEGGWTRAALLARARAQSARFVPGSSFGPVDTESLLLEEIGVRATGRPAETWVVPANLPPQKMVLGPSANLLAGTGADGPVRDLPADLVDALGAAGGLAFNASDLADLAVAALGTTVVHDAVSISEVTAVDGPSRWSLGAAGWCPCPDGPPQVVGRSGRAGAWAAAVAYDFAGRVAVGITVDREVTDEQLQALTEAIISATR